MQRVAVGVGAVLILGLCLGSAAVASPVSMADLDCSDFSSQASAQSYFISRGGPASDPDRLDADGDGIACESLPCPCSGSSPTAPVAPVGPVTPSPTGPPSCGVNDPVGLRFDGLPSSLIVGERVEFGVDEGSALFLLGPASVRMLDEAGGVFASAELEPALDEAWLRLDLGDQWATIEASATEYHVGGATCVRTIAQRVDAVTRIYLSAACYDLRYRPSRVVIACADGNFRLRRLRWENWNSAVARADGIARVNDCLPACAGGRVRHLPVRVKAFSRKLCAGAGRYVYSRLTFRMLGRLPRGVGRRTGTVRFGCGFG